MTYTDLDDLKSAWQSINQKLERQNALALHQFRESKMERFRAGFRPLIFGNILQILSGLVLAVCGGSFWYDHWGIPHLMWEGISLHVYGIMFIAFAARDLVLIKKLDYAAPVLTLQKQIATLRDWRARAGFWFGVSGCFIWIPLLLVLFHWLGDDVWERNLGVVGWFFFSAVISLGILLGIVAWSRRPGRERMAGSLNTNAAGRSVAKAQSLLAEIQKFEES